MMSALPSAMSGVCTRNRPPSTPARVARLARRSNARDEFRPAVGIAGVVERVDADDDVVGAEHLGPAERQRQENRVPRRHVGRRNLRGVEVAIVRHGRARGQRRAADRPQIRPRARGGARRRARARRHAPTRPRARGAARSERSARTARNRSAFAIAAAVYESRPPLRRTTARIAIRMHWVIG